MKNIALFALLILFGIAYFFVRYLEKFAHMGDDEYKEEHDWHLDNAKKEFTKLTQKDVQFLVGKRFYEGDADGGSRYLVIREK